MLIRWNTGEDGLVGPELTWKLGAPKTEKYDQSEDVIYIAIGQPWIVGNLSKGGTPEVLQHCSPGHLSISPQKTKISRELS